MIPGLKWLSVGGLKNPNTKPAGWEPRKVRKVAVRQNALPKKVTKVRNETQEVRNRRRFAFAFLLKTKKTLVASTKSTQPLFVFSTSGASREPGVVKLPATSDLRFTRPFADSRKYGDVVYYSRVPIVSCNWWCQREPEENHQFRGSPKRNEPPMRSSRYGVISEKLGNCLRFGRQQKTGSNSQVAALEPALCQMGWVKRVAGDSGDKGALDNQTDSMRCLLTQQLPCTISSMNIDGEALS